MSNIDQARTDGDASVPTSGSGGLETEGAIYTHVPLIALTLTTSYPANHKGNKRIPDVDGSDVGSGILGEVSEGEHSDCQRHLQAPELIYPPTTEDSQPPPKKRARG